MRWRRGTGTLLVALFAALVLAPDTQAVDPRDSVSVTVDRASISTRLGGKVTFRSTITNRGARPVSGLIAHLNVLSLRDGVYVDPEDWSSHRTRYLAAIAPGRSRTTTWRVQAVNHGQFGVYVAVLDDKGSARAPNTAPAIRLAVENKRTLNSGGILPLALGMPAFLGLLALGFRLYRRR